MFRNQKSARWPRFVVALACLLLVGVAIAAVSGADKSLDVARKHGEVYGNYRLGYSVRLKTRKGVNAVLPLLDDIPKLVELRVYGVDLNSKEIQSIAGLESLNSLWLDGCGLQGEELDALGNLSNLKHIRLFKNPVSDRGMQFLASLPGLERVDLTCTQVQGSGVQHLKSAPNIRELRLTDTLLSDDTVGYCAELVHLESLSVEGTSVTTSGLMRLTAMHWLKDLAPPNSVPPEDRKALGRSFIEARQQARENGANIPSYERPPIDWLD